jgi:hypothetical protein
MAGILTAQVAKMIPSNVKKTASGNDRVTGARMAEKLTGRVPE